MLSFTIVNNTFNLYVNGQLQNNGSGTIIEGTDLRQDISGKYSNLDYGIINLDIPQGWYASEGMFGDKGISINIHPGSSDDFMNMLTVGETNSKIPIMSFVVVDKEEMRERQSMTEETSSSFTNQCTEVEPNSTATIESKTFEVSTMKCTTVDLSANQIGDTENADLFIPEFGKTEVFKKYEHETPDTIYTLQLTLSSEYSPNNTVNEKEIAEFTPILDKTVKTIELSQ